MAYSATGASGEFHVLCEISLDTTTLRYADDDISVQTVNSCGYFYEGKLLPGSIIRQMNSAIEPVERIEMYDLVIDNRDDEIASQIYNDNFANKEVTVRIGEGNLLADYSTVLRGVVAYPNGVRWDEDQANITVLDRRVRDRKILPIERFDVDDFPLLEQRSRTLPQPIIYGDWRYGVDDGIGVPAYCVNTTTKTFRVAGHDIKEIQRVLKNAIALDLTANTTGLNLATSQFSLSGVDYNATSDVISANVQGHNTINGTLIESPDMILRHIYTRYCDLTATDLNITAFSDFGDDAESLNRRCISAETSTEALVGELLNESNVDMRFIDGKYAPKLRELDSESNRPDMRADDISVGDDEKALFSVEYDPERYYCNQIIANYDWNPVEDQWNRTYTIDSPAAQTVVDSLVQREWSMNWTHQKDDVVRRGRRELIRYSSEPVSVNIGLTNRALLKNLADQFDLTHSVFTNRPFQVQRMDMNLTNWTAQIRGEDMWGMAALGRWTSNTADNWGDSGQASKTVQGYWTDGSGQTDPGDYTSIDWSLWY